MERAQILVIAVVVAALALFGLRFFSHDEVGTGLEASAGRVGDLGAVREGDGESGGPAGAPASSGHPQSGRVRPLGGGASNEPGARAGGSWGGGGEKRGGGSALVTGSGALHGGGGGLGVSGSARVERGAGSGVALTEQAGGRLAPRAQLKDDLVESLSERPPNELGKPLENGEDVALKVDKPEDIASQAGQDEDVKQPDEGGDGIKISDRGRIEFPNAGNAGETGTISFQIKPEWAGADQSDNALVQIRGEHQWNNRLELVKNGEFLRFIITDDTGKETDISTRISNWQADEQHDIRATWGENRTTLYIDGQVAGQNTYPGTVHFADVPMFVGADYRGSTYAGANATLYDFTLNSTPAHP